MTTQVISPTYEAFKHAHTAATTAKNFYLIGSKVVMAMNTAAANAENVFVKRCTLKAPKLGGQAWATPMVALYWDDTAKNFTTVSTSNTLAGRVHEAAGSSETEGFVELDPSA